MTFVSIDRSEQKQKLPKGKQSNENHNFENDRYDDDARAGWRVALRTDGSGNFQREDGEHDLNHQEHEQESRREASG
jgi:hypothetical protein